MTVRPFACPSVRNGMLEMKIYKTSVLWSVGQATTECRYLNFAAAS